MRGGALGRRYAPDARDRAHRMRALVRAERVRESRHWYVGPVLDQGDTPQCVGYACRQLLASSPLTERGWQRVLRPGERLPTAAQIYHGAQQNDEWDGQDYDGTSARGALKWLARRGLIDAYVWGFSLEEVLAFVLRRGPVLVGTEWFTGMDEPDERGYLRPTGTPRGGHEWLVCGVSHERRAVRMVNSWGEGWGERGRAWVAFDDLEYLVFGLDGDAVSALERGVTGP